MTKLLLGVHIGINIGILAGATLIAWYVSTDEGFHHVNKIYYKNKSN